MSHLTRMIFLAWLCSTTCYAYAAQPDAEEVALFKKSLNAAQQGGANSQFQVAMQYMSGKHIPQDINQAFFWFGQAANQGHAEAQYHYANFLIRGVATTVAPEIAFSWYKKSAEQGNLAAQNSLGIMYMAGIGTAVNNEAAFKWLSKVAAAQGADAMYNLGQLYEKGLGVEQDSRMAISWYEKAAKLGHATAEFELGVAYAMGLGDYKVDKAKAREWYRKSANQGLAVAQYNLADMYMDIRPQKPGDRELAMRLFKQAADQGLAGAQYRLGIEDLDHAETGERHVSGLGWLNKAVQQGYQKALSRLTEFDKSRQEQYLEQRTHYSAQLPGAPYTSLAELTTAAQQGNATAQGRLATAYQYGLLGLNPDLGVAADWYIQASKSNEQQAREFTTGLSQLYITGIYHAALNRDDAAVKVKLKLEQMAERGELLAMLFMARFYSYSGTDFHDHIKSAAWYEKAALVGNQGAQLAMARLQYDNFMVSHQQDIDASRKSIDWYRKVAVDNMPYAQLELAKIYLSFSTDKQDYQQAQKLLHAAASNGVVEAKFALAQAYTSGQMIAQDKAKAAALYNGQQTEQWRKSQARLLRGKVL